MQSAYQAAKGHLATGVGRLSANMLIEKAAGSYLWDALDNRRYLDFTSGIGVTNTGHCHPTVVKAIQEQAGKLIHSQASFHRPMAELTQELLKILPSKQLDTLFFVNSGSEAVENAMKVARYATGKPNIIVVQGGYHGRTIGTMSLTTSDTVYRSKFGPLMPGVFVTPFPYHLHMPWLETPEACSDYCIDQLKLLLKQQTSPEETAAVLIEPVLGEGGYVVPPIDFLQKLKAACQEHDLLLICDEVQTGFGRTGKYFSVEHFAVEPDILIMAKGIASGMPLSAIAANASLLNRLPLGTIGGTYAGNPLSCAAALATLRVFEEEKLLQNAMTRGAQVRKRLQALRQGPWGDLIRDVRGLGLMNALEFHTTARGKSLAGISKQLPAACLKHGLLILRCSAFDSMRFIPPLNVNEGEVDEGMDLFERAFEEVATAFLSKSK